MEKVGRHFFVSIDDTDNLESRGTGHRARLLGALLAERGLAKVHGISRHQLYVHDDIPYTSHNSSLCLDINWHGESIDELESLARQFLLDHAAPGSDAAYCIAEASEINNDIIQFGRNAKCSVLTQTDARTAAKRAGFRLEGVTGDEGGVIGALAAVGLRKTGHDGRFVWVEGVRELNGVLTLDALLTSTGIDEARSLDGTKPDHNHIISVDPWPRPVLIEHKAILLVERVETTHDNFDWRLVPKEVTKQY